MKFSGRGAGSVEWVIVASAALSAALAFMVFRGDVREKVRCFGERVRLFSAGASCPGAEVTGGRTTPSGPMSRLAKGDAPANVPTCRPGERCTKPGNCFEAGTLVRTPHGSVAIETIAVGDWVLSRDPESNVEGARRVVALQVTPDRATLALSVHTRSGAHDVVHVTGNHPLFVVDRGWAPAATLTEGDAIVTQLPGDVAIVESVVASPRPSTVYNFEVDELHTYFVGESGLLVHNDCPDDPSQWLRHPWTEDEVNRMRRPRAESQPFGFDPLDARRPSPFMPRTPSGRRDVSDNPLSSPGLLPGRRLTTQCDPLASLSSYFTPPSSTKLRITKERVSMPGNEGDPLFVPDDRMTNDETLRLVTRLDRHVLGAPDDATFAAKLSAVMASASSTEGARRAAFLRYVDEFGLVRGANGDPVRAVADGNHSLMLEYAATSNDFEVRKNAWRLLRDAPLSSSEFGRRYAQALTDEVGNDKSGKLAKLFAAMQAQQLVDSPLRDRIDADKAARDAAELLKDPAVRDAIQRANGRASHEMTRRGDVDKQLAYLRSDDFLYRLELMDDGMAQRVLAQELGKVAVVDEFLARKALGEIMERQGLRAFRRLDEESQARIFEAAVAEKFAGDAEVEAWIKRAKAAPDVVKRFAGVAKAVADVPSNTNASKTVEGMTAALQKWGVPDGVARRLAPYARGEATVGRLSALAGGLSWFTVLYRAANGKAFKDGSLRDTSAILKGADAYESYRKVYAFYRYGADATKAQAAVWDCASHSGSVARLFKVFGPVADVLNGFADHNDAVAAGRRGDTVGEVANHVASIADASAAGSGVYLAVRTIFWRGFMAGPFAPKVWFWSTIAWAGAKTVDGIWGDSKEEEMLGKYGYLKPAGEGTRATVGSGSVEDEIASWYDKYLGRKTPPSPEEIAFHKNHITTSHSIEDVRKDVAGSGEAMRKADGVFREMLGRDASPAELERVRQMMVDGKRTLDDVRFALMRSTEGQRVASVRRVFDTQLGRAPSDAELRSRYDQVSKLMHESQLSEDQALNQMQTEVAGSVEAQRTNLIRQAFAARASGAEPNAAQMSAAQARMAAAVAAGKSEHEARTSVLGELAK